jgi:(2R)-ethylmalonyl-CoA mutase
VNKFVEGAKSPLTANDGSIMLVDADAERDQLIRLEKWRENRNSDQVKGSIAGLKIGSKKRGKHYATLNQSCKSGRHHGRVGHGYERCLWNL